MNLRASRGPDDPPKLKRELMPKRVGAKDLMQFYWDTIEACVPPEAVLAALRRGGFEAPKRAVVLGLFSEYVANK